MPNTDTDGKTIVILTEVEARAIAYLLSTTSASRSLTPIELQVATKIIVAFTGNK